MEGIKHLIECHCILPQFRGKNDITYHKFIVFSIIDDSDTAVPKYVQCNNCGVVHKVFDICKSEIVPGRDELKTVSRIEDIKLGMSKDLISILETYDVDQPTWEHAKFILTQQKWGNFVILSRDYIDDDMVGKRLFFENENKLRVEDFMTNEIISLEKKDNHGH